MNDEMFDRVYQQGRAAFNRDIDAAAHQLAKTVGDSLRALHRLEWGAPWKKQAKRS